jgi:hypothetical protein
LLRESREKDAFQAFAKNGFFRWKDVTERFKIHKRSALHLAVVSGLLDAENTPIVKPLLFGLFDNLLQQWFNDSFRLTAATFSNILKKDMENKRSALKRIFSSIRYLCMQGLAILGKTEEGSGLEWHGISNLIKLNAIR